MAKRAQPLGEPAVDRSDRDLPGAAGVCGGLGKKKQIIPSQKFETHVKLTSMFVGKKIRLFLGFYCSKGCI